MLTTTAETSEETTPVTTTTLSTATSTTTTGTTSSLQTTSTPIVGVGGEPPIVIVGVGGQPPNVIVGASEKYAVYDASSVISFFFPTLCIIGAVIGVLVDLSNL